MESNNSFHIPGQPPVPNSTPSIHKMDRTETPEQQQQRVRKEIILLPLSFFLALCLRIFGSMFMNASDKEQIFFRLFGIFWLIFALIYMSLVYKKLIHNKMALLMFICGVLLAVTLTFLNDGLLGTLSWCFTLGLFLIPLLFMITIQMLNYVPTQTGQQNILLSCFVGIFSMFLTALGKIKIPFQAIFGKSKTKMNILTRILIGVVIAIPIALVAIYFLTRANEDFNILMQSVLKWLMRYISLPNVIGTCLFLAVISIFAYSFLWNATFQEMSFEWHFKSRSLVNTTTIATVLCVLLFVYGLFCFIQFNTFLEHLDLPTHYSSRARSGLLQLMLVCFLNIAIFFFTTQFVNDKTIMRILLTLFLGFTIFIASDCFIRVFSYVQAYGAITYRRAIGIYLSIYIVIALLSCIVYTWKRSIRLSNLLWSSFAIWSVLFATYYTTLSYIG